MIIGHQRVILLLFLLFFSTTGCSIKVGDVAISRSTGDEFALVEHAVPAKDGRLVSRLALLNDADELAYPDSTLEVLSDSLMDSYRIYRVIAGTKYEVHLLEDQFMFRTD
ncbi:MAG: hypothetical protein O3B44_05940 [Bacteroidetes bacterium]|nr:hypothetical protein [Bacteroidota bacterium]